MDTIYMHTMGDSTIDNRYWLINRSGSNGKEAEENCIEGKLESLLKTDTTKIYRVKSHAYDGFTTSSLLRGDVIGNVLPYGQNKIAYLQQKVIDNAMFVKPFEQLQQTINEAPESIHYVVLSVGGNDFRVNLANPINLLKDIPKIQERYIQIVEKIRGLEGKDIRPILMLQYRTDAKNKDPYMIYTVFGVIGVIAAAVHTIAIAALCAAVVACSLGNPLIGGFLGVVGAGLLWLSTYVVPIETTFEMIQKQNPGIAVINALMQIFYKPVLDIARQYKLPILDLSNTFNPYDALYTCGIEPNEKGGELIAEGIAHIVQNHDYTKGSMLYAKSGSSEFYTGSENDPNIEWKVK